MRIFYFLILSVFVGCSDLDISSDAIPQITASYGIYRGLSVEWILSPSFSQFLASKRNIPTYFEISYSSVSDDNWIAVANVSGQRGDSSRNLPEVQRVFSRVSTPGTISRGTFRLSVNRAGGFANQFDKERRSRTARLNFDASAEDVQNEINSLDIGSDILPVKVERDGPFSGNAYSWRVTFSSSSVSVTGTPLLIVSEEKDFAPGIWTGGGRVVSVEKVSLRNAAVKPPVYSPSASSPFPGVSVCTSTSVDDYQDSSTCQHSLTGLTPGGLYRVRIRTALFEGTHFSPFSRSSSVIEIPREVLKGAQSQPPAPILHSLLSNSVVLDVQLPYSDPNTLDPRPFVNIEVQAQEEESNEVGQWKMVTSEVLIRGVRYLNEGEIASQKVTSQPIVSLLVNISEGLSPLTTYKFRHRGFAHANSQGRPQISMSRWSLPLSGVFTLPSAPLPPLVKPLRSEDISYSTLSVYWTWPLGTVVSKSQTSGSRNSRAVAFIVEIREVLPVSQDSTTLSTTVSSDVAEGKWTIAQTADSSVRETLLRMGDIEASVRVRCGGEKKDLRATQAMLDYLQSLKDSGWINKISVMAMMNDNLEAVSSKNCTYKVTVVGLKSRTVYQTRISAVAALSAKMVPSDAGPTARLLFRDQHFVQGEFSPPSKQFRTPMLPNHLGNSASDHIDNSGLESSYRNGQRSASLIERMTILLAPFENACIDKGHVSTGGANRDLSVIISGESGGENSYHIQSDPEYRPGVGLGGSGANPSGGPGLVVFSSYTDGDSDVPYETVIYRYDSGSSPSYSGDDSSSRDNGQGSRRSIVIPFINQPGEGDLFPQIYQVPSYNPNIEGGGINKVTRLLIRAWGGGGGCGARLVKGTTANDTGTYAFRVEGIGAESAPNSTKNKVDCNVGGGGAFVRAWVAVNPGDSFAVFLGSGGKSGTSVAGLESHINDGGWFGGGRGGIGARKNGGGGGGSSIVFKLPTGQVASKSFLSSLVQSISNRFAAIPPTIVAAGGGGGGGSDYSLSNGGSGGSCTGGVGGTPWLSPRRLEATDESDNPNERANTIRARRSNNHLSSNGGFDPLLTTSEDVDPSFPYYGESLDFGFSPEANFSSTATGGQGGEGGEGGLAGRKGSYAAFKGDFFDSPMQVGPRAASAAESNSANSRFVKELTGASTLSVDVINWIARSESGADATPGRLFIGGTGGSGWDGGGGGGGGLFGGGGGGAGVDGAGGGGGSSYVHAPHLLRLGISEEIPSPKNLSILALNSVSVALAWMPVVWPASTSSGGIIADSAVSYVIEQAVATEEHDASLDSYKTSWKGTGIPTVSSFGESLSTMIDSLQQNSFYSFRIIALSRSGNASRPSAPLFVHTPAHAMNEWKRQSRSHAINDDRQGFEGTIPGSTSPGGGPPPLRGASLTTLGSQLFLFGGLAAGSGADCADGPLSTSCLSGATPRNETWRLDPLTWSWSPLIMTDTPPGRERHAAAAINDRLYIFGGRSHPDSTRDGGPYLPDMWVLDVGESSLDHGQGPRTVIIQAPTTTPLSLNGNNVQGNLNAIQHDMSCANVINQTCGIPELLSPVLSITVPEDNYSRIDSYDSVPRDSCAESVKVWLEIAHPCLNELEIYLIGPGPEVFFNSKPAADDLSGGFSPAVGSNLGEEEGRGKGSPYRSVGTEETLLFSGGSSSLSGSASNDFYCRPGRKLSSDYFKASEIDEPISSNAGLRIERAYDIFQKNFNEGGGGGRGEESEPIQKTQLLEDTRIVIFDDDAIQDVTKGCCDWKTPEGLANLNKVLLFKPREETPESGYCRDENADNNKSSTQEVEPISSLRGHFRPMSSFSRYTGQRAAGTWALRLVDRIGNNVTGELRRWGLIFETAPCERKTKWTRLYPPPASGYYAKTEEDAFLASLPLLRQIPTPRVDSTSIVIGSSWFLWGGSSQISYNLLYSRELWRFDSLVNRWTLLQPMSLTSPQTSAGIMNNEVSSLLRSPYGGSLGGGPGSIGPGLLQQGVLTSFGLVAWGGLGAFSQPEANFVPGYATSSHLETCVDGAESDVTYACASQALATMTFDFLSSSWMRLHPSLPQSLSGPSECIGSSWCVSPPHIRHGALTIIGEKGSKTRNRGVRYPTLVLFGGAHVNSGSMHRDLWTLELKETISIGGSFLTVQDEGLWPIETISNSAQEKKKTLHRQEGTASTLNEDSLQSLCWSTLLHGSTADTEWKNRCLRDEINGTVGSICFLEDVFLRAYCTESFASIGVL